MAGVVLDTTVVIDVLCGRPATARLERLLAAGDDAFVCVVTIEETVRGLRPGEEEAARTLFDGLYLAPLGDAEGWRAGEWRRELGRNGVTISQADALIASAAFSIGGRLATGNPKHFPLPELAVEHWPAGE